jgi:hypothetical protein
MYWSDFDGTNWALQQQIPNAASSVGPSLAPFGGDLYAAFKGANNDQSIWYSFMYFLH